MPSSVIVRTSTVGSSGPGKIAGTAPCVNTRPSPLTNSDGVLTKANPAGTKPPSYESFSTTSSAPVGWAIPIGTAGGRYVRVSCRRGARGGRIRGDGRLVGIAAGGEGSEHGCGDHGGEK